MNYPILIVKSDKVGDYILEVADLPGCKVGAPSIEAGLSKLYEEIASHLGILVEYGEQVPHAKSIDFHIENSSHNAAIWAVIDFDIVPYLGKSHKINVTLPELLIKKIDDRVNKSESYKTRSGFIASACMKELALK